MFDSPPDEWDAAINGIAEALSLPVDLEVAEVVRSVLREQGDGYVYLLWRGDVRETTDAAVKHYGAGKDVSITIQRPELLVYNRMNGSGYAETLPIAATVKLDHNLFLDEGSDSFTTGVCGGWSASEYDATFTIHDEQEAQAAA